MHGHVPGLPPRRRVLAGSSHWLPGLDEGDSHDQGPPGRAPGDVMIMAQCTWSLAAEQRAHRAVPQQAMLSAPAAIAATRHATCRCAFTPHSPPGGRAPRPRSPSPARSARAITGTKPGVRHEIRVVERYVRLRQAMQQSHLQGVLSNGELEASDTPILPGQRAPFMLTRPKTPLLDRWIEA